VWRSLGRRGGVRPWLCVCLPGKYPADPGQPERRGSGTLARPQGSNKRCPQPHWPRGSGSLPDCCDLRFAVHWPVRQRAKPRVPAPFRKRALSPRGPTSASRSGVHEEAMREEDFPAQQPETAQEARIPDPDAHARGTSSDPSPAFQGSRQPLGLIWRVRDRSSFRVLARGRRSISGCVEMRTAVLGPATEPPRVAYAVGRNIGPAVVRNRVRRRLRAAVVAHRDGLQPGHGYLLRPRPGAAERSYADLSTEIGILLSRTRSEQAR
jgi:ribonuclease P protein component